MHGQKNIKLYIAEQAKRVYQNKNKNIKLYKNNAAIWYNKTCTARQLTPVRSQPVHYTVAHREWRYQML
jgi:hypothetical protein